MKRSPSVTRTYLRQLAEPVPRHIALLTPRRPVERSTNSALDAIPLVLDSVTEPHKDKVDPHIRSTARVLRTQQPQMTPPQADPANPSAPSPRATSIHSSQTSFSAISADESFSRSLDIAQHNAASPYQIPNRHNDPPHPHEDHQRSSTRRQQATSDIASSTSTNALANQIARDRSNSGIRVHIGTVEVRAAAPVREPKQAPAIDRGIRSGKADIASEPLSRGLAWSHGLVQG